MSQFIKRPGKPHNGDWAHDNNTDTDVCLECKIKTVNGDNVYWIARQKNNSFTIVNESYLSNIGYYGE